MSGAASERKECSKEGNAPILGGGGEGEDQIGGGDGVDSNIMGGEREENGERELSVRGTRARERGPSHGAGARGQEQSRTMGESDGHRRGITAGERDEGEKCRGFPERKRSRRLTSGIGDGTAGY